MSNQTALSRDLNVEDFRRLGVRPNEVRLSVIRGAASRNAMPLATELLSLTDGNNTVISSSGESIRNDSGHDSWLQLSRVVTSTYRLLDPRLRSNAHQRAYVGRILPLALSAAATTRFQPRGTVTELPKTAVTELVPPPVSDLFRGSDNVAKAFAAPTPDLSDAETWQLSLDDRDLASGGRLRRRYLGRQSVGRNARIWSAMAACGVLIGSILGWNSLSRRTESIASNSNIAESSEILESRDVAINAGVEPNDNLEPAVASIAAVPANAKRVADVLPADPFLAGPFAETAANVPNNSESSMATPISETPVAVAEIVSTENPTGNAVPIAKILEVQTVRSLPEAVFPTPRPEDVAIARRRLLNSIDAFDISINSVNFKTIRDTMVEAHSRLSPGSVDHYAAATMLASLAWLESGPRPPSLSNITSRLAAYHIDENAVWTQSYIDASQHVTLPGDLNQFYCAGFGLIEKLMKREAFDRAGEVLTVIQQRSQQFTYDQDVLAESTETDADEKGAATLIASYQKSLQYAQRLSTTAQRVLRLRGQIETIPSNVSGGSSLGRYYCLVLGDWCQGLRFLAETSDPRLAALARTELELHADDPFLSDPFPWAEVADRWQRAADRLSGRAANNMRLHAIELLEQSSWRATAIAKSNAGQRTEAILDRLPLHLKLNQGFASANAVVAVAATEEVKTSIAKPKTQKTTDPDRFKTVNDWMVGRIKVKGEDLGVRFRYQLGVAINPNMLQSIAKQLRQPLDKASISLEGNFRCEKDQWVILALSPQHSPTVPDSTQPSSFKESLFLNGEPIRMEPTERSTRLLIPAGEHVLRWKFDLNGTQSTASCSLRDARTGQRLELTTSPKEFENSSTGDLTVSVMRSNE